MPGRPGWSLVSMGNYIFKREVLERVLVDDGGTPQSRHDFGRDIIPKLVAEGARVDVYDFAKNAIPGEPEGAEPYWRDVGTIDSYFTSNMELRARVPCHVHSILRLETLAQELILRHARFDLFPHRNRHAGRVVRPFLDIDEAGFHRHDLSFEATPLGFEFLAHAGKIFGQLLSRPVEFFDLKLLFRL